MIKSQCQNNICITNQILVKPEYLNHPSVSGNKYSKLKYNLIEARQLGFNTLLTFGGAFSNHIAAVAAAGKEFEFKTIGVIRGDELFSKIEENTTLKFAREQGMQLKFISRSKYRTKDEDVFKNELLEEFGDFYLIPEGGTNEFAIKGCEEILTEDDKTFDFICCPVGTGGTISGIINSSSSLQKVIGFPALKGQFLNDEIRKYATKSNWELCTDYHFGGYGKINLELIEFINGFKNKFGMPLDPVYTGKMMFGIFDLLQKNYFHKNAKILAIHTGGLQGIDGMNQILKSRRLPLIG